MEFRFPDPRWSLPLVLLMVSNSLAQQSDRYLPLREQMVHEYIESEGVTNPRVLDSMRSVPRHEFVRPELKRNAYFDQALDIGYKQTISPPFIVAYMTEILDPQPGDVVLEIGTGSGYQAAVLSSLVKDVYTIEIVEPLGRRAASLLRKLGYENVHCKVGDGYQGWPEHAPFDKIIVTCSPEDVPRPLIQQLKEGGRMIIPLGERYQQVFYLFEKKDGMLQQTKLLPTLFVPMTGKMEELREKKPDPAHPQLVNGDFETDANGDGLADGWHYQRRSELVNDAASGSTAICFSNDEPGRMAHMLQALAIDGQQVSKVVLSGYYKTSMIHEGRSPEDLPGVRIYFYDDRRLPVSRVSIGPWVDETRQWTPFSATIEVPPMAKEAIIQAGLSNATGKLWLDDIRLRVLN
jgi:protein-L-isoaspartate(D-aspartate) O-methyltransferase